MASARRHGKDLLLSRSTRRRCWRAAVSRRLHEGAPEAGSPHEYFNRTMEGLMMPIELLGSAMTGKTLLIEKPQKLTSMNYKKNMM